ncbi:MAG: hypothetical protein AB7E95_12225 [Kiritimatiellales bacterium]
MRWMVGDIADFSSNHYRTNTHPLGVLLVNPIGVLLALITGSQQVAALVFTACLGGGFVVLLTVFLLSLGCLRRTAVLCSFLGGLSSCHLLWSAVPDYFLLDGFCLLLFCWMVTAHGKNPWLVLGSAVAAGGAVTSHFLFAVLIFIAAKHGAGRDLRNAVKDGIKFMIPVAGLLTGLAVVQDIIYPSFTLFFHIHALQSRTMYMHDAGLAERFAVFGPYLFLFNIVFPKIVPVPLGDSGITGIRFCSAGPCVPYLSMGSPLVLMWGALLIWMVYVLFRTRDSIRTLGILFMLCFLLESAIHLFYGRSSEFFLYTPHWTFMLPVLVGLFLTVIRRDSPRIFYLVSGYLFVFLVFLAANNIATLMEMFRLLER